MNEFNEFMIMELNDPSFRGFLSKINFHNLCEYCILCQKLFHEDIQHDKKIQIVDVSRVNNIPSSIKSIPTLVINNKEILSGKKVFDYFNKSDEIEYLNFSGKNSGFGFSSINDNDVGSIESNTMFSSIDMPSISDGIPKWEENDTKEALDIDKLQAERDSMFKAVQRQ